MRYWDLFTEWASRPENTNLLRTLGALLAIPGAIAGIHLFWRRLTGRHPEIDAALAAGREKMAIQHQNALREIAARVSDLYAKVSTVIWADVKEHAVPDTLLNNIKSEAQHLKESLDKAMGLGLEDIIRSQRQAADHLYRMFSLALEQIANSPDPGTTKQLCMQEQLSLGLVRVINELFSKGLISQQYISDQFRSDEDPSGAMGLKVLTDRAWNS